MENRLYSVFKHESFDGIKWGVQMPRGILGFKTKRQATKVAEACLTIALATGKRVDTLTTGKDK